MVLIKDLKSLNCFKYGGHAVLMGKYDHSRQDSGYILKRFDRPGKNARKRYLKFIIKKGMNQGRRPELSRGGINTIGRWVVVTEGDTVTKYSGKGR